MHFDLADVQATQARRLTVGSEGLMMYNELLQEMRYAWGETTLEVPSAPAAELGLAATLVFGVEG